MLYYSHPAQVIIHQPATIQRSLTLDDYLQLQMLLRHEQAERERRMRQHRHHQHHHSIPHTHAVFPSEQLRIQRALENLKQLKENYRRERAQRIQRYMDHYRRQALIAAAAAQDEYYRQCLAAAIEQQRAQELWRQYQMARRDSMQESEPEEEEEDEEEEEEEGEEVEVSSDEDPDYEDYRAERLATLLKILFGQPAHQDHQMVLENEQEQESSNEDQEAEALWRYINEQQQQDHHDIEEHEDDESDAYLTGVSGRPYQQAEQQREEEGRNHEEELPPLQTRVLNLKDLLNQLVSGVGHEHEADEPKPSGIWAANEATAAAQPPPQPSKDSNLWGRNEATARPSLEAEPPAPRTVDQLLSRQDENKEAVPAAFGAPRAKDEEQKIWSSNEATSAPASRTAQPPPPKTMEHFDHLASSSSSSASAINKQQQQQQQQQPLSKTTEQQQPTVFKKGGVWDKNEGTAIPSKTAQPPPPHATEHILGQQQQKQQKDDEGESPVFAPKQVVTPAEPQHPSPPPPDPQAAQKEAERVNRIAEQHKQNLPSTTEDPVKVEKRRQLDKIRQQLRDIQQEREAAVLAAPLQFTKNEQGTLNLTATTPNNRGFLGYEDEIMRIMLKLDAIESDGDEDVRNERKLLVKQAEAMLERLDEHKQQEWEKARKRAKNQQQRHKKKKHKKHYQNRQRQPVVAYA